MTEKELYNEYQKSDCKSFTDFLINKIGGLEKENAELKAKNKWYSEQVCNKECAEVWGNLTKAKEIIRELIHEISVFYIATDRTIISPTVKEAEQFLSSEVEKCGQ